MAIFPSDICYNVVKRQFIIAYTQLLIPVLEWKLKSEAIDLGFSRREKIVRLLFKLQAIRRMESVNFSKKYNEF